MLGTLGLKMFGPDGLFMELNVYVLEGKNGEGRVATPTSISTLYF